jgi:hypothetical protein
MIQEKDGDLLIWLCANVDSAVKAFDWLSSIHLPGGDCPRSLNQFSTLSQPDNLAPMLGLMLQQVMEYPFRRYVIIGEGAHAAKFIQFYPMCNF